MIKFDDECNFECSGSLSDIVFELSFCYKTILSKLPRSTKIKFSSDFLRKIADITREAFLIKD